jgi:putative FmdB family regulatory protein
MPTYEYACQKCGHKFEAFQSITEKPLKKCPNCSGPVKRLISPGAGLIFKGSGFYITDYKKKESVSSGSGSSRSKPSSTGKPKEADNTASDKTKDTKK